MITSSLLCGLEQFGSTQKGIYSNPNNWTSWIEYLRILSDDYHKALSLINHFQPNKKMEGIKLLQQNLKDIEEAYKIAYFAKSLLNYPKERTWTAEESLYFSLKPLFNKNKIPKKEDLKVIVLCSVPPSGEFVWKTIHPSLKDMRDFIQEFNLFDEAFDKWLEEIYGMEV